MENISKLQHDIQEWSDKQFGNDNRTTAIAHHLHKEVHELIDALIEYNNDLSTINAIKLKEEFADCFMLLVDAAAHVPFTMDVILNAMREKLEINKKRKWGKPDNNGVCEHIK